MCCCFKDRQIISIAVAFRRRSRSNAVRRACLQNCGRWWCNVAIGIISLQLHDHRLNSFPCCARCIGRYNQIMQVMVLKRKSHRVTHAVIISLIKIHVQKTTCVRSRVPSPQVLRVTCATMCSTTCSVSSLSTKKAW